MRGTLESLYLGPDYVVVLRDPGREWGNDALTELSEKLGDRLLIVLTGEVTLEAISRQTLLEQLGCRCGG